MIFTSKQVQSDGSKRLGDKLNCLSGSRKCFSVRLYYRRAEHFMTLHMRPVDSEELPCIYLRTSVCMQIKAARQCFV